MSRSEYQANKEMATLPTGTKSIKDAPVGYVTGPVIRDNEKPAETKQGDVNDSNTWALV